jgi:septum site-determining protein MinC
MNSTAALNAYEIKSASLPLVSFLVKTADLQVLELDLTRRLGATPGFFDNDAVVIDLSHIDQPQLPIDFGHLVQLLKRHQMLPVAIRGAQPHHMGSAALAGLFEARDLNIANPAPKVETVVQEVVREVVKEVVREVPASASEAMIIDKPLRSGQHVYARGRDLVVLAMVNPGAEIMADGHIHVYAPLRGKAIAGAKGNEHARIFTDCLEAELISIAGTYRTSETPLPPEVASKRAQIMLQNEKLVMQPL